MLSRYTIAVLALSISLTIAGAATGQQLQWKLAEDDQFTANLTQTTEVTTVGGFESKQTLLYELGTAWKVTDVGANKSATVQITIKSIRVKIDNSVAQDFAIDVDTDGKTPTTDRSKTFSKHMKSLLGKTFSMEVTPTGKVTHLPLPPETKKTIEAFPKTDYVLQNFHVEILVHSMTTHFPEFANDLAKGKSWSSRDPQTAANESFTSTTTYEGLKKIGERDLAQFRFKTEPKQPGDRKVSRAGRDPFVVSKQTGNGTSLFDPKKGNFTNSSHRSKIESTTEFEGTKSGTRIVTDFEVSIQRK